MTKQYTSLEHSIRNIMEGRSNKVEPPKTLEQSILEGGHTLEEKVSPRKPNANNTSSGSGDTATAEAAAGVLPFVGTTMDAVDAYNAYKDGEYGNALGIGALAAAGLVSDIGMFTGLGTGPSLASKAALTATRIARAVDRASDVADVAKTANKVADAASDSNLIRRITSGKKKGSDTPPLNNAGQEIIQGNTRLKPGPEDFKPTTTRTDDKIDVPKPDNDLGAPGTTNVTSLPSRTTQVTPSNPNTKVTTPVQTPANVNTPIFKPSAPVTTVRPSAAANQTTAPNVTRTDAGDAATRRNTDSDAVPSTKKDKDTDSDAVPSTKKDKDTKPETTTFLKNLKARLKAILKAGTKLKLSLPSIKTDFDSQSAAGQASGVETHMHKADAPLKVTEENEADKARTSIENVARLNSRRSKAVKQQEIQKKILDEKKSLADTVKRNVEEIRTKRKTESPIITNPELKRPEPEGINNVR